MITIRKSSERGHAEHGWLDSRHTFSFADYYDPEHVGFRALRVINEDRVQGGQGFGAHSHQNMEIISYVLEGGLAHKDSLGTGAVIRPGEVQLMSAGKGVVHSEFNESKSDDVHFLQIWLIPDTKGIAPSYQQKAFPDADKRGRLRLVAAREPREGSLHIHSDADVYAGIFGSGERAELALAERRHAWVQVARGKVRVNDQPLEAGDGAAISDERSARVEGIEGAARAEILVFDLA